MAEPALRARRRRRLVLVVALLVMLPTALAGAGCLSAWLHTTEWPRPVELHRVRAADGWELAVARVVPAAGVPARTPVVLVHGLVTNGRNHDLEPGHSLARDLSARGFDVWVPSLRGVGPSRAAPKGAAGLRTDFDAFVTLDLVAVLEHVRAVSGADAVDYVGHSMGGLVLYAHLARGGGGIRRAVTLGSPVRFRWGGRLERVTRRLVSTGGVAAWFPLRLATHASLPLHGVVDGPVERLLVQRENVPAEVWRRFLAVGVDDLPSGLLEHLGRWVLRERFESADGELDYLAGLARVETPLLVVAGKVDGIAPPWTVRPAFDAAGSAEKRWLVIGEGNGMSADYNHMDLLLGTHAPTDVFAHVAAFLSREAPPARVGSTRVPPLGAAAGEAP